MCVYQPLGRVRLSHSCTKPTPRLAPGSHLVIKLLKVCRGKGTLYFPSILLASWMTYNTVLRSRGTAWTLLCGDAGNDEGGLLGSIGEEEQEKKCKQHQQQHQPSVSCPQPAPLQSSKRGRLKQQQWQHPLMSSISKSSQRDEATLRSEYYLKSDKENHKNNELEAICPSRTVEPREKREEGSMCDISFELSELMVARGVSKSEPELSPTKQYKYGGEIIPERSAEEECNETPENNLTLRIKGTLLDSDSLKKDLALLGMDKMLDADELSNVKGASRCIHELLSERTRQVKFVDALNQELSRIRKESESLYDEKGSLAERLEAEQRSFSFLRQRITAAEEDRRVDCAKWKDVKDEMESTNMQLRQRVVSYRATLRKKELEYQRLQDALCRKETKDKGGGGGGLLS